MGDHALYAQTKNLLSCAWKGWIFMSYTLASHHIFNWYHNWYFCVSHISFSIYVCFKFQLVLICFTYLVSKIYHIFQLISKYKIFSFINIKMYKCFNFNWYHKFPISYGIKILWYLKLICWFKKNSKFVLFIYNYYLKKNCLFTKVSQNVFYYLE